MTDNVIHPDSKAEQTTNRNLAIGIGVGVFGAFALFYILFIATMLLSPGLFFRLMPLPTIVDAVLSDGRQTYLLQQQVDMSTVDMRKKKSQPKIKHLLAVLNGSAATAEQEIPPYAHASGSDRGLLFVAPGSYRLYVGQRWSEERSDAIGSDPVGLLAPDGVYVLSNHKSGPSLSRFNAGNRVDLPLPAEYLSRAQREPCRCACVRLVWHRGRLCLFWQEPQTLSWAVLDGTAWSPAATSPFDGGYDVLAESDSLYLFQRTGDGPELNLTLSVYRDETWSEPISLTPPGELLKWDVFLQQGQLKLYTQRLTSSSLATVADGRLVDAVKLKGPLDFAGLLGARWMILWTVGGNLLSLLAILGVSALIVRFKKRLWQEGETSYEFATLFRRFAALLIDKLLLLIPPGLIVASAWRDLDTLDRNPLALIVPLFGALILFVLGSFLYHSLLEGLYGQTVGKRLCGLRVLKADFTPCTVSAGFLRNLLRLADAFFSYLVAVIALCATPKWQRVGDQVAETVVVRERR